MFRYLISYTFEDDFGTGEGNTELRRPEPIRSMDDLVAVTDLLRHNGVDNPTIRGFSPFDSNPAHRGVYLITYAYQADFGIGHGRTEMRRSGPIRSMDDITAITDLLRQSGVDNPTVRGFQLCDNRPAPRRVTR